MFQFQVVQPQFIVSDRVVAMSQYGSVYQDQHGQRYVIINNTKTILNGLNLSQSHQLQTFSRPLTSLQPLQSTSTSTWTSITTQYNQFNGPVIFNNNSQQRRTGLMDFSNVKF